MKRRLPDYSTDFSLLDDVVRVHQVLSKSTNRSLYDWWTRWNEVYFENTLRPLFLGVGNTDYGKWLGTDHFEPMRQIVIQKQGSSCAIRGEHHVLAARRHEAFANLSRADYATALILLHEMMHQACHEAGEWVDNCHQGPLWIAHCNYIGNDLGLGLTYSQMKRGKERAQGKQPRANVWQAVQKQLLPATDRFATYDECRMFPFRNCETNGSDRPGCFL